MNVADVLCLLVALGALGTLGGFVVLVMRAQLPQAQSLLALSKLKDLEDEKLKKILERVGTPAATTPGLKEQLAEMTRRAQAAGFTLDTEPKPQTKPQRPMPTITPPPEPTLDLNWGPFVE